MEIGEILKKPFTDTGKFVVGVVLSMIPIANFTLLGFGVENFKDPKKLPEFSFDQFVFGIKAVLLGLAYALIPIAIAVLGVYTDYLILVTLSALVALALMPVITYAILLMGKEGAIRNGLRLGPIVEKTYGKEFITAWVISALLSFGVNLVLGLIPILGWLISSYVSAVVFWTSLGSRVKI